MKFENKLEQIKEKMHKDEELVEELEEESLDQVNGAGNPFEDIPRVPTQPIDDELRNKA